MPAILIEPVKERDMSTLKEQGYRFLVSPDDCDWIHPAEVPKYAGWTDRTDMSDAEFDIFMAGAWPQPATPT